MMWQAMRSAMLTRTVRQGRYLIMREAQVWRVKAADLRRMAQTSKEVERERKLLQLAALLEAQADAAEPPAKSRPRP
jgi:hypothetical protein